MNYTERLQDSRRKKKRIIAMKNQEPPLASAVIAMRIGCSRQWVDFVYNENLKYTGRVVAGRQRSLKGGQNRSLKQAKNEQSSPKGNKVDPDY